MLMQQQDVGYQVYGLIQKILRGEWRVADACPDVGVWRGIVQPILDAYRDGFRTSGTVAEAISSASRMIGILKRQYPEFAELLGEPVTEESEVLIPELLVTRPPALPILTGKERGPDLAGLGGDACLWLDRYIAFSKEWSTRGYELFHEAVGLWILSAIAMRRIYVPLLNGVYTPLYIALASKSSGYRKSTTVNVGAEVLRAAGLSHIFMTDKMTPQVFIRRGGRYVPENYSQMSPGKQQEAEDRLLYGGKQSFYIDEFLPYLHALASGSGMYAGFTNIFLEYYDTPREYANETIGRGLDFVDQPYMSAIVNFTPAHLQGLTQKGSINLWLDGTWPRWVFITPPASAKPPDEPMPDWGSVPGDITLPLARWHERLGKPTLAMTGVKNNHEKETGKYEAQVDWPDPQPISFDREVKAAYDAYDRQVNRLLHGDAVPEELHMWYVRSPLRVLRVAALFASFENGNVMELRHFARAVQIAERWRGCVHEFYRQVNDYSTVSEERKLDNKILERLREAHASGKMAVPLSYLQQRISGASADALRHSIEALVRAEMIIVTEEFGGKNGNRRLQRFSLPLALPPQ